MNKCVIVGRLTKDVELRHTQNETAVASFTLAVNRKDKADFINCVAWNKQAEFISKYFNKGSQICLVGRLQTRDYEKDGKKVFITEVITEEVYFTGKKETNDIEINYTEGDIDLPF